MSSVNIFPTKIYHVSSDIDCQQMLNAVKDILASSYSNTETNNQVSMRGDGLCSYNVSRKLHHQNEFQTLIQFIEAHATTYWKDLGYMSAQRPVVFEMWTNVYKKNSAGQFVFIESATTNSYTIHVASGEVRYDDFAIKAVCSDATESANFSPSTTVQTGPGQLLMFAALALLVGFGMSRRKLLK